jgi:nitrogen fixation NifU-like protein
LYNEKVLVHFFYPRNVGEIPDADGSAFVGDPACGDSLKVTIKVEKNVIKDVKFLVFGCGAAIATSSMMTELAKGKTIEKALEITDEDITDALGGLPEDKLHCSVLGAVGLKKAILDYLKKREKELEDKRENNK